jgi:uncharacterized membrane protein YhaH (DUF805 family)
VSIPNGPIGPYSPGSQDAGQHQGPYVQPDPYGQQQGQYGGYGQQPPAGQYGYGPPYAPPGPDGYLRGGAVGFADAIRLAFQNAFVYQGRASRSAYWWFALFTFIVYAVAEIVVGVIGVAAHTPWAALPVYFLLVIATLVVSLPLAVRRLHDTDKSGFWLFLFLVPFGGIALLVFYLLEGTRGPNRFG